MAEHGRIAWMPNASAVGNARGDEDAVAFTESPDPDEDTGESSSEVGFQGADSVLSHECLDPDDADTYALAETTRECDAATAEIAVSGFSSWERFPQQTQAAGESQHTKSTQTIWEAAVAAKNQNEPEDGIDLAAREAWHQRQLEHAAAVPNELAKLDAERKGSPQQQKAPPPKCPVQKAPPPKCPALDGRGKVTFLKHVEEIPCPSPCFGTG